MIDEIDHVFIPFFDHPIADLSDSSDRIAVFGRFYRDVFACFVDSDPWYCLNSESKTFSNIRNISAQIDSFCAFSKISQFDKSLTRLFPNTYSFEKFEKSLFTDATRPPSNSDILIRKSIIAYLIEHEIVKHVEEAQCISTDTPLLGSQVAFARLLDQHSMWYVQADSAKMSWESLPHKQSRLKSYLARRVLQFFVSERFLFQARFVDRYNPPESWSVSHQEIAPDQMKEMKARFHECFHKSFESDPNPVDALFEFCFRFINYTQKNLGQHIASKERSDEFWQLSDKNADKKVKKKNDQEWIDVKDSMKTSFYTALLSYCTQVNYVHWNDGSIEATNVFKENSLLLFRDVRLARDVNFDTMETTLKTQKLEMRRNKIFSGFDRYDGCSHRRVQEFLQKEVVEMKQASETANKAKEEAKKAGANSSSDVEPFADHQYLADAEMLLKLYKTLEAKTAVPFHEKFSGSWKEILKASDFSCYREPDGTPLPGRYWETCWASSLLWISVDSKHIRLAPTYYSTFSDSHNSNRRAALKIDCVARRRLYSWSFVRLIKKALRLQGPPPKDLDKLSVTLSSELFHECHRNIFRNGGARQNSVRVVDEIARKYVDLVSRCKFAEARLCEQTFAQRVEDILFKNSLYPTIREYAGDLHSILHSRVADFILKKVLQENDLRLRPDHDQDVPQMLFNSIEGTLNILKQFGRDFSASGACPYIGTHPAQPALVASTRHVEVDDSDDKFLPCLSEESSVVVVDQDIHSQIVHANNTFSTFKDLVDSNSTDPTYKNMECHRLFAELVIKIRAIVEQSFLRAVEPTLLRPFDEKHCDEFSNELRDADWEWKFDSNIHDEKSFHAEFSAPFDDKSKRLGRLNSRCPEFFESLKKISCGDYQHSNAQSTSGGAAALTRGVAKLSATNAASGQAVAAVGGGAVAALQSDAAAKRGATIAAAEKGAAAAVGLIVNSQNAADMWMHIICACSNRVKHETMCDMLQFSDGNPHLDMRNSTDKRFIGVDIDCLIFVRSALTNAELFSKECFKFHRKHFTLPPECQNRIQSWMENLQYSFVLEPPLESLSRYRFRYSDLLGEQELTGNSCESCDGDKYFFTMTCRSNGASTSAVNILKELQDMITLPDYADVSYTGPDGTSACATMTFKCNLLGLLKDIHRAIKPTIPPAAQQTVGHAADSRETRFDPDNRPLLSAIHTITHLLTE